MSENRQQRVLSGVFRLLWSAGFFLLGALSAFVQGYRRAGLIGIGLALLVLLCAGLFFPQGREQR